MVLEYDIVDSTGRVHALLDRRPREDPSGSNGTRAPDKDEFHAGLVSPALGYQPGPAGRAAIQNQTVPTRPFRERDADDEGFLPQYSVSGFTD